MTDRPFRLRDVQPDDVAAMVEIHNRIYPSEPITLAEMTHWENTYPEDNPRLRYAAVWEDGGMVALGSCLYPFWLHAPGVYWLDIAVHPDFQRRGIGHALLAPLEAYAWVQGAERMRTSCREDMPPAIRFLERTGFATIGIRFESTLDLDSFDETPFVAVLARVQKAGYTLTTLADEERRREDADRALFDLYRQAMADVPFPGGARPRAPSFEIWRSWMLEGPVADPAGIFIAKLGEEYVGLTQVEVPENSPPATGSTGILREHRRQGLALALKLLSFRFLRRRGCHEVRAHNDTANPAILALNEKLGYQRLPGWLTWDKLNPSRNEKEGHPQRHRTE